MKTLTKEQRHEVYKTALERIQNNKDIYSCNAILRAVNNDNPPCGLNIKDYNFTEFFDKKPLCSGFVWFSGPESKQKRIEILTQCIEETL